MAYDKFFIAPLNEDSGLQNDVLPWLISDKAFSNLENAYVFRGRVRKRFGSRWMGNTALLSRFRMNIGTIVGGSFVAGAGFPAASLPASIGQMFSVDDEVFTINVLGTPALLLKSGTTTTATFNTTTGALVITGSPATDGTVVYFYPALPVMGLLSFQDQTINQQPVFGFDTRYAYQYSGGWERLATGASVWAGSNDQFFWGETWFGDDGSSRIFFVTNFNELEPMRQLASPSNTWSNFQPPINAAEDQFLFSALILVAFKNRLLAFNTWEGASPGPGLNYQNRCRYSQVGSPVASGAWASDMPGKGNAIDAATTQAIITVEIVKDRLIVFFEQSTWELVYTGNQAYPFSWQQINSELGAESTFSIVPFDKVAIGVGNVGIMACSGTNVERIDAKIPDEVFQIHNIDGGVFRVYGVRDYFVEMIYWTFPDEDTTSDSPYPNRVLVYNYANNTWSLNDDSITAFGYFQDVSGVTWDSTTVTWDSDITWNSGELDARFRNVIGGNQEGFTFIIDPESPTNASVLQITDITETAVNTFTFKVIDHNLKKDDYIYFEGITDSTGNLTQFNDAIYTITTVFDSNTFEVIYDGIGLVDGTYSGAGLISRVSNITITTKEYNFYAETGQSAAINKVNFLVDSTAAGQMQVDYFVNTSYTGILSSGTGSLLGTGTLDTFPYPNVPYEATAARLWHTNFTCARGNVISLQLSMNDAQLRSTAIRDSGFALHAFCFEARPVGRLQ